MSKKKTLTKEKKSAVGEAARKKYPGERIFVKDETDDEGNPQINRLKIEVTENKG